MKKILIFSLIVMGLSGMVAQISLLRELLIIFYGNELTLGISMANWLILEAIGAFLLGRKVERLLRKLEGFVALQIVFSLSFPFAIYFTRVIRDIAGIVPGEGMGLLSIFFFSFLVLLPVSITHGASFTFGCKIFSLHSRSDAGGIGRVYVYETAGTILGGFLFIYLFLPHFNSFQIAFLITLMNFFFCSLLLGKFWQKKSAIITWALGVISSVLLILNLTLFSGKNIEKIHRKSIERQWRGYMVKHYQNTFFGNIVVAEKEGAFNFFFNGIPVITVPYPNISYVEEFAHFSLLSHPSPKEVLVISGGAGGLINEILKHSVERVDYVELDPLFLETVKKFSTLLTEAELNDPRVKIEYTDGRFFIKRTDKKYDLILLGFSNPSDLQINRYFSQEFFFLVKRSLKEGGIFAFNLPSLPCAIINLEEIRDLIACILNSLKKVFPYFRIIPGDGNNLFLASNSTELNFVNPQLFIRRLTERKINTSLLIPVYIEYRLKPWWYENFLNSFRNATQSSNQDFKPLATFYSLAYWNALFSPYLVGIFLGVRKTASLLTIFLFSLLILFIFFRKVKLSIPLSIGTTGFSGMLFDLIFIFAFQVFYGYIFYWIGFLVTALMTGIAMGGVFITKKLEKIKKGHLWFLSTELSITLFAAIIPFLFFVIRNFLDNPFVFLGLAFFSGVLIGVQFPLANKIYLQRSPDVSKTAGILYGMDLLGGWVGGILGGVFLLPFLGISKTCVAIFMLKLTSFIVFLSTRKL